MDTIELRIYVNYLSFMYFYEYYMHRRFSKIYRNFYTRLMNVIDDFR